MKQKIVTLYIRENCGRSRLYLSCHFFFENSYLVKAKPSRFLRIHKILQFLLSRCFLDQVNLSPALLPGKPIDTISFTQLNMVDYAKHR